MSKESPDEYIARFNRESANRVTSDSAKRNASGTGDRKHIESEAFKIAENIHKLANEMDTIAKGAQLIVDSMTEFAQRDHTVFTNIWSQKVSWTNILGDVEEVEARGETLHEAIVRAYTMAEARGWEPKRWWQIWRWQDTPDMRRVLKFYGLNK